MPPPPAAELVPRFFAVRGGCWRRDEVDVDVVVVEVEGEAASSVAAAEAPRLCLLRLRAMGEALGEKKASSASSCAAPAVVAAARLRAVTKLSPDEEEDAERGLARSGEGVNAAEATPC